MNHHFSVVLIGAGNVATQTGLALQEKGHSILQVFSRTELSARILAEQCHCEYTTDTDKIYKQADIYIYSVKDDVLPSLISRINIHTGLHVHTAGSVPASVFKNFKPNYGVFYPMQTFSKSKKVNFDNIPIFVEANSAQNLELLEKMAHTLSQTVVRCNSAQREALHLAAVFCCNFTNHLYLITSDLLKKNNLPFSIMLPLIHETVDKLQQLSPAEAQTGPAVRNDTSVMNKHLESLVDNPDLQNLYTLFSKRIQEASKNG